MTINDARSANDNLMTPKANDARSANDHQWRPQARWRRRQRTTVSVFRLPASGFGLPINNF